MLQLQESLIGVLGQGKHLLAMPRSRYGYFATWFARLLACVLFLLLSGVDTVNSRLSSEEIYMCDSLLDLVPKAACRGSGKLGLGVVGTCWSSRFSSDMLWGRASPFKATSWTTLPCRGSPLSGQISILEALQRRRASCWRRASVLWLCALENSRRHCVPKWNFCCKGKPLDTHWIRWPLFFFW